MKIIKNTKNDHFLMVHHRKVVREIFFRVFGDIILVKSLFRTIRFVNRTNSRPIWTRTGEERYHWKKVEFGVTVSPPKKKNAQMLTKCCPKLLLIHRHVEVNIWYPFRNSNSNFRPCTFFDDACTFFDADRPTAAEAPIFNVRSWSGEICQSCARNVCDDVARVF